jgi:predicted amidohydrolase
VAAEQVIARAGAEGAGIICFPECFVPGYRSRALPGEAPDESFLRRAMERIAAASALHNIATVLGTERLANGKLLATVAVFGADGRMLGFQDKEQIDPSEEGIYFPGDGRRVFEAGPLKFGVAICHEGWRYPETVRFAARRGAQVVFHPHYHWAEPGDFRPTDFADPRNTFHEKAGLCRAAENTCYFASVNYASDGSPTTSAVARPDGTLQCFQPYGQEGVLIADLDLSLATGLLARRWRGESREGASTSSEL